MIPLRHQHLQPQSFVISQRVELLYKLFLLENAKKMFERELNEFVNEVSLFGSISKCVSCRRLRSPGVLLVGHR